MAAAREPKHRRDQAHGLFDIISCRELSLTSFLVLIPQVGNVAAGFGLLLRRVLDRTRMASTLSALTCSHALQRDGWTPDQVCTQTLYHTHLVTTTACHGDDFIAEATLGGARCWENDAPKEELPVE